MLAGILEEIMDAPSNNGSRLVQIRYGFNRPHDGYFESAAVVRVPSSAWPKDELCPGDAVEMFGRVQGIRSESGFLRVELVATTLRHIRHNVLVPQ